MKSLVERTPDVFQEREPSLPVPLMNIKVDFDGHDLSVCHIRSREPAPHIEELFEAILAKDVNPFNPKDVEAYKRLTSSPIFCIRIGDYYLIIPDTVGNRRVCRTMSHPPGIRWDVL